MKGIKKKSNKPKKKLHPASFLSWAGGGLLVIALYCLITDKLAVEKTIILLVGAILFLIPDGVRFSLHKSKTDPDSAPFWGVKFCALPLVLLVLIISLILRRLR